MKVKDFMISDVISVSDETTIEQAISLFVEHRIGGVPVVDRDNKLIGMLSDGDVLRYLSPQDRSISALWFSYYVVQEAESMDQVLQTKIGKKVSEMMNRKQIVSVSQDDDFENAIRLLSQHHFKKLPVVDEQNRVIGVISRGDIIYNLQKRIIA